MLCVGNNGTLSYALRESRLSIHALIEKFLALNASRESLRPCTESWEYLSDHDMRARNLSGNALRDSWHALTTNIEPTTLKTTIHVLIKFFSRTRS